LKKTKTYEKFGHGYINRSNLGSLKENGIVVLSKYVPMKTFSKFGAKLKEKGTFFALEYQRWYLVIVDFPPTSEERIDKWDRKFYAWCNKKA